MSFLVRPVAVLTNQFVLSYEVGDDDRFSPVVGGCVPLPCPVDSLCMLLGSDIKNAETGPQAEVWDWRSVICGIAHSSQLPALLDSDCPDRFREVGMTYALDLSVRGTHSHVKSPGGGLVTNGSFAASSVLPGGRIDVYYDRNRARLYTNARLRGKLTFPGRNP